MGICMFPYFEFFGRQIGSYAICAMAGLALCCFCAYKLGKKDGIVFDDLILVLLVAAGGLLLGGHILYGFTHIEKVIQLFERIGEISFGAFWNELGGYFGGMVYYGGFLGGLAGVWLYTRKSVNLPQKSVMDLYVVAVPLFHSFGRIGCFLGGCCFGIESRFGFVINGNTISPEINGVRRFPVQLVEATLNLALFFLLLAIYRKGKHRGHLICYYLLLYPSIRFILEFLRGDAIRGFLFGLSTSQWISLILWIYAVWLLWRQSRFGQASKKKNQ